MRIRHFAVAAVLLLMLPSTLVIAAAPTEKRQFPPKIQAVVDYLLNTEYPELFGDRPYHIRPTGYAVGDLDGDGVDEVVMSFYPHYLQSPTVVIFHVDKHLKVTRVIEGLAPGPLEPLTDDYLDSHSLGMAADFQMGKAEMADPKRRKTLVQISLKHGGNIVEYRNFFHMDQRKGKGSYIDMTRIKNPPQNGTCAGFQFSKVEHIEIDYKKGEKGGYLLALAGNEIYIYKIKRFLPNGLLEKSLQVVPMSDAGKKE